MFTFESFEARQLLADVAGITVKLTKTGTLQVNGTAGADVIQIRQDGDRITVRDPKAADGEGVTFLTNLGVVTKRNFRGFDASLVERIKVDAGAGKDAVDIAITKDVPATLDGGKGNDTLITAGRRNELLGGAGNDYLLSRPSDPLLRVVRLAPGGTLSPSYTFREYRDSLVGADVVTTEAWSRTVVPTAQLTGITTVKNKDGTYQFVTNAGGRPGAVVIDGGNAVVAATGNRLDGGDGDDRFESRGGEDSVIGGAGNDSVTSPVAGTEVYFADLAPLAPDNDTDKTNDDQAPSRLSAIGVEVVRTDTGTGAFGKVLVSRKSVAALD